jgi:hypothetical protein
LEKPVHSNAQSVFQYLIATTFARPNVLLDNSEPSEDSAKPLAVLTSSPKRISAWEVQTKTAQVRLDLKMLPETAEDLVQTLIISLMKTGSVHLPVLMITSPSLPLSTMPITTQ